MPECPLVHPLIVPAPAVFCGNIDRVAYIQDLDSMFKTPPGGLGGNRMQQVLFSQAHQIEKLSFLAVDPAPAPGTFLEPGEFPLVLTDFFILKSPPGA